MQRIGEQEYYRFIMGDSEESMKAVFHNEWISFLNKVESPYGNAIQLRIGNHLRPMLVYWGHAMGTQSTTAMDVSAATEMALCIEIMHKVSIIVDDLIDFDAKRHNQIAFHKQFSPEETIIFAVYMLGKAFEKMDKLCIQYPNLIKSGIGIFAKTLSSMATGCLQELSLTSDSRYDIKKITDIISMETSSLIKNSALLGYLINQTPNQADIKLVEDIGDKVGFLFQAMNDLEPFNSCENIAFHKGKINADIERYRKNLIVAYIYGMCSIREKQYLTESIISSETVDYLFDLYKKYNIYSIVEQDLKQVEDQIDSLLIELKSHQINAYCIADFRLFFKETMKIAKDKLFTRDITPID